MDRRQPQPTLWRHRSSKHHRCRPFSVPPPPERWPSRPPTPSGARAEALAVAPADAGGDRFARGLLIHRLLQVLPEVAPPRAAVGAAMLARPVHGLAAAEQAAVCRGNGDSR